jgi:tight adherence protein B
LQIRQVDARGDKVIVDAMGWATTDLKAATFTMNGKRTTASAKTLSDAGVSSNVVAVIDSSASVDNAAVQLFKEDLSAIRPGKGAITKLGLVSTSNNAAIVSQLASNIDSVKSLFNGVNPVGDNGLWNGVKLASSMLEKSGESQRNIVVFAASNDAGKGASYTDALEAVSKADASIHVVMLDGSTADATTLHELVDSTGGSFQVSNDNGFTKALDNVASMLDGQTRFELDTAAPTDADFVTLTLKVGSEQTTVSFRPRVLSTGPVALTYVAPPAEKGGLFANAAMKYVILGLVAVCAGGAFFAVAQLAMRRNDRLDFALRHYDESYVASGVGTEEDAAVAKSALVQRAVEVTGAIAERQGLLARVQMMLERADLPLRPAEALTFYMAGAVLVIALAAVLTGNLMTVAAATLLALIAPGFAVDFMVKRRKRQFTQMLPDMLQLLSGTLRAGYSINQGIEAVATEVDDPMGKELRRAVTEIRLGRQLDEALESVANRMNSGDFAWAVMAIRIQREVGGNLAELLMTVADTMTQRERLRRDVSALTAEGRMSAIILGLLPPGLGVAMYAMNPDYIAKLFSGTGLFLLVASIFMMLIGFFWMKKTVTIEV